MMVLIALIGTIALSSLVMRYAVSVREANELVQEAYQATAAGDYDTAIARYTEALKKPLWNQQKAFVYTNRGYAYNSKRQFVDAIADQSEAIRLNRGLSYAFAARGYAYVEHGELDKGLTDLSESIRLDPSSDSAYYDRGLLLNRTGAFSDALKDFDEAVRCSPERADRLVARGLCYFAMDDFDRALANFDGAIATEPSNPVAYLVRSNFYARRGNADKQQADYQQALGLNPNAENLRMEVDKWFGDKSEIAAERKQSFDFDNFALGWSIDPHLSPQQFLSRNAGKNYHELFREAQAAHNKGSYEDEIALWNDVVAMNISALQAAPAVMNRGSAYSASGDLDRALRDYNEAIRLDPRNAGAYVNRALALARKGSVEAAMVDYAKAIALNPRQWQAYFNRAAEFKDRGQLREAVDDLNKVMELNPEFTGAYMNRADIYVRQRDFDKAVADYNIALLRDPKLADVYVARANIFIQKRSYQEAVRDLQTAAQMKTKRPERVLNSLAWLRATCPQAEIRNGSEAVELALKGCDLSEWKDWRMIDTLAAAYAERGDFDQAIKYQNQVLQISKSSKDYAKIKQHLALYERHTPCREDAY